MDRFELKGNSMLLVIPGASEEDDKELLLLKAILEKRSNVTLHVVCLNLTYAVMCITGLSTINLVEKHLKKVVFHSPLFSTIDKRMHNTVKTLFCNGNMGFASSTEKNEVLLFSLQNPKKRIRIMMAKGISLYVESAYRVIPHQVFRVAIYNKTKGKISDETYKNGITIDQNQINVPDLKIWLELEDKVCLLGDCENGQICVVLDTIYDEMPIILHVYDKFAKLIGPDDANADMSTIDGYTKVIPFKMLIDTKLDQTKTVLI